MTTVPGRRAEPQLERPILSAGTGSEVTLAAVVSDSATHARKFFIDPKPPR